MLSKKTIKRIIKNSNLFGVFTVIGKYSYAFNNCNGYIYRCKTEDISRAWVDQADNVSSAWEFVTKV